MLLVEVYIDKSLIHGLGVFSARPIKKGTEVWRFIKGLDLDLDPSIIEKYPPVIAGKLLHYGYIESRLDRLILCSDDARFMNHSDKPNLYTDYSKDKYGIDYALNDIQAGEELTVDYRTFEGEGRVRDFE